MTGKYKALAISTARANGGMAGDILDAIADAYFEGGMDLGAAIASVQDQLVQAAIDRYSDKIRAALARAGLEVEGELSLESIKAAIIEKTGLDLADLTPDAMVAAVDQLAARRLSDELGIEVASIAGGNLGEAIRAGVAQSLADGRTSKLLGRELTNKARAAMTWKRQGIGELDQKRIPQKVYQKRYRRHHVEVWD